MDDRPKNTNTPINQTHSGLGDNVAGDSTQQGNVFTGSSTGNFYGPVTQISGATDKAPGRTGDGPPTNLGDRGIDNPEQFVGREGALAELQEKLQRSERVAIASVAGMGGVGKTELAVQFARWRLREGDFLGGVVWLAGDRAGLELVSFARSRLFPEWQFPEDWELRDRLDFCFDRWPARETPPESVLLIFDDVTDYASQVKPFLPTNGDPRFRVLVTTRRRLEGIGRLNLDVLRPLAALQLLVALVGRERVGAEAWVARALVRWLGCLPLALELVGQLLAEDRDLSLARLLEQLRDERLRHEAIESVEVAFNVSWGRLSGAAQQLARGLSLFADAPIPWELMDGVIGACRVPEGRQRRWDRLRRWILRQPVPEVQQWCGLLEDKTARTARRDLVRLHLLTQAGDGVYRVHPLVREFLGMKLEGQQEAGAWRSAFAQAMQVVAKRIGQTLTVKQVAELEPIIAHLKEAARLDAEQFPVATSEICTRLDLFYGAQGLLTQAQEWSARSLEIRESQLGPDHPSTATSLNNLAELYRSQGRYEEAEPFYLKSLQIKVKVLPDKHPSLATGWYNVVDFYQTALAAGLPDTTLRQHPLGAAILQKLQHQHPSPP